MPQIEIFRAGTHRDTHGVKRHFSPRDIDEIAAAYSPANHEAPIVVGHPKTNAPAWGWIKSLVSKGGRLQANTDQVEPSFAEAVKAGAYKKVSASFYSPVDPRNPTPGKWQLRHVGFLGAMPPAVKGLRAVAFSDVDYTVAVEIETSIAFAEEPPADYPEAGQRTASAGAVPTSSPQDPLPQEQTVTPEAAAALQQQNAELQAQVDQLEAARAAAARASRHAEHVAYAENLASQARIPSEAVTVVAALRDVLRPAEGELVAFGEGDAAQPLDAALQAFFAALPQQVAFGEQATRERVATEAAGEVEYAEGSDPERIALDKRIRAYMTEHKTDYLSAAHAVAR